MKNIDLKPSSQAVLYIIEHYGSLLQLIVNLKFIIKSINKTLKLINVLGLYNILESIMCVS